MRDEERRAVKVLLPLLEPETSCICILKLPDKEIYPNEGEIEKNKTKTEMTRMLHNFKEFHKLINN